MSEFRRRWMWLCPECASSRSHMISMHSGGRFGLDTRLYGVYQCQKCWWGWLNPQPQGDLQALYPAHYLAATSQSMLSGLSRWYRDDQYAFDFHLWSQASGKTLFQMKSYLDIGAGSGERVAFLQKNGVDRVAGIDEYDQAPVVSQPALQNVSVEEYFPDSRYAVAGLFHVLEHVPDPRVLLQHVHAHILREAGELILQVPNFASLERRVLGRRWHGLDVPRHLWHFTPQTLSRLLEDTGYEVIRVEQRNAVFHPVTSLASLAPQLDIQRIWIDSESRSAFHNQVHTILWTLGTVLTMPWSWILSFFSTGSMLTVVARKKKLS